MGLMVRPGLEAWLRERIPLLHPARFSGLTVPARMRIRRAAGIRTRARRSPFLRRRAMSNNVYSEIHLHVAWHVKLGAAVDPAFEAKLYGFIRDYAARMQGVIVHAVNGVHDHIHLAVTVPPTLNLSEWLGRLKGASAYYVNEQLTNRGTFGWQAGYGVVSFGTKDLPWVVAYVERQKEHHAAGKIHDRLEPVVSPLKRAAEGRGRAASSHPA